MKAYIGFMKDGNNYRITISPPHENHPTAKAPEFVTVLYSMMEFYKKMPGHITGDPVCVGLSWHEAAVVEAVHELLRNKQINVLEGCVS